MSVPLAALWANLGLVAGYDLVVAAIGLFPDHTLAQRTAEDIKIAGFICLAHVWTWLLKKAQRA